MSQTKKVRAKTMAERQKDRDQKIKKAGLVQRKVVGHPDDFNEIREYAENLYKKRGLSIC